MKTKKTKSVLLSGLIILGSACILAPPSHAGVFDKIKKKIDKATDKVDKATNKVDETTDKVTKPVDDAKAKADQAKDKAMAPVAETQAKVNAAQAQVNNAQANLNQAAANQVQKTKPVREAQQAAAQMQSKAAQMQNKAAQMQNTANNVKNAPQIAKAMAQSKVNQVKATPAALKNQLLSATRLTDVAFAKDTVLKKMGVDAIASADGKTLRLIGSVASNADKIRANQLALKNFKNVKNEIVVKAKTAIKR